MSRALALAGVLVALLAVAAPANADLRLKEFTTSSTSGLAGAHPDVTTTFSFADQEGNPGHVDGTASHVRLDLPPGLIGDTHAVTPCSQSDFETPVLNGVDHLTKCTSESQVGVADVIVQQGSAQNHATTSPVPVYSIATGPNEPALLGIPLIVANVYVHIGSRTESDFGLSTTIFNVPSNFPLVSSTLTLWGVPADHNGSGQPRKPFMTNPTSCAPDPPVTKITAQSLEGATVHGTSEAVVPPSTTPGPITGCDGLAFAPLISVAPATTQADSPSGFDINLTVPQNQDPDGRATSQLHSTSVTLPRGVGISPSAADGLQGCTDDQLRLGSNDSPSCPDASKVGTVSFDVPLLAAPVTGDIFLGAPKPGNPYRLFLVGRGSGLIVKLVGSVHPDPATGQLTTTFPDNPQVPFSNFTLHFKGGPRAMLDTPRQCGDATTTTSMVPWSGGAPATPSSTFTVTGCGAGFSPGFLAGPTSSQAGAPTGFVMRITRDDGQPELGGLKISLPPGLLGKLTAVPLCPAADASAGNCGDASRVGSAVVSSGPGPQPLSLPGTVYLAAPSHPEDVADLAIVTHAVAGPFDLGTIVVRTAIRVRADGGLDLVSEPLPTDLAGINLRLRTVSVVVDREGFMSNPTSCAPLQIAATIGSASGDSAAVQSPFRVSGCDALPLRPKLAAKLGGKGQNRRGAHPPVTTTISQPDGDANLRKAVVALPLGVVVDFARARHACPIADFDAGRCSPAAKVGTATASTPVLPQQLSGPVWLVSPEHALPGLVAELDSGPVHLNLPGATTFDKRGRVVNTFDSIPDVPISSFALSLDGGSTGVLLTTTNLCKSHPEVRGALFGQNGKRVDLRRRAKVAGCPKPKSKAHQRRHGRRLAHARTAHRR